MDTALSICIGIGLAAACGFRIFVPLLVMSIAAHSGHITLAQNFQWIGTTPALVCFSVATALEIAAYYIPWLDNALDSIATPAAIVAGTVVTASMVTGVDPFLRWTLAVIAGGGAAGLVQGGTVIARAVSSTTTGGLGNLAVATAELGMSAVTSILAIVLPIVALLLLGVVGFGVGTSLHKRWPRKTGQEVKIPAIPPNAG